MKKLRRYFGKIYFAISWTIIVLILLSLPGSMMPKEPTFIIPGFDKIVHAGLFGGFVFLWCFYYSTKELPVKKLLRTFFIIFVIGSAYGIGTEYLQKYFIPLRDYDTEDILADIIGAGLAYGICNISLID